MNTEQRIAKRLPSSRPVVFLHHHQNSYATMTDFSEHGIGFVADIDLPEDELIEVHFDVVSPQEIQSFQFKAEVKHCTKFNNQCHIGVQFDFTSQAYSSLYNQLACA
ncbi:MAG: PilZ domain-containing protein [Pseudomonadota bacterium]|nr:PilZ domain-containing protein [Pseudomonadota bacterium]